MKLKIAICDDEPIFCESTKEAVFELKEDYEIDVYQIPLIPQDVFDDDELSYT